MERDKHCIQVLFYHHLYFVSLDRSHTTELEMLFDAPLELVTRIFDYSLDDYGTEALSLMCTCKAQTICSYSHT
jgi:hypothetical protein